MLQIDPKKIRYFDYILFLLAIFISVIGIITISSTGRGGMFALRQVVWVIIGVSLALGVSNVDTRHIKRSAWIFYGVSLFLLILVFAHGVLSHGARRWIAIYSVHLQPSEFIKVAIILMLSAYFDENPKGEPYSFRDLIYPILIIIVPVIFILKQPDLGTAIIILVIALSIILLAGVKKSLILKFVLLFVVFLPFVWSNLQPYQKDRIMGFLDPYSAPTTYGYNTIQSEIAIGSGGVIGKGIRQMTQSHLSFLPENHTDFIFSVFAEEWGFVGCAVLVLLYFALLWRAVVIAKHAKSDFDRMVCVGIISFLWISIVFNIGMAMGLLPVVGVPLVFFSYGGSSIVTAFFALGILLSVRFKNRL